MKQKKIPTIKNTKDKEENVIVEEDKIMERWREYFKDLLEGHNTNENKSEQKRNKQIK